MDTGEPSRGCTKTGLSYLQSKTVRAASCPTLILVHGMACSADDFTYLIQSLRDQNAPVNAIAVSLPGHGSSSIEAYPNADMVAMADSIRDLVDELSVDAFILLGHSMGSRVVVEALRRWGDVWGHLLQGITFLDGSHYKIRMQPGPTDARRDQKARKEQLTEGFEIMFSSHTPHDFREAAIAHAVAMNPEYFHEVRRSHLFYDLNEFDDALQHVGNEKTPTLSLQSSHIDHHGQRISLQAGNFSHYMNILQQHIPQAHQVVIPGSMHFPHVDQPALVAAELRKFTCYLNV